MKVIWFILLGSLYLFSAIILFRTSPFLSTAILFTGLAHFTVRWLRPTLSRRRRVRKARREITRHIIEHIPVLAHKRGVRIKKDDYGIVHYDEWEQEKEYFITTVLGEYLGDLDSERFPLTPAHIDAMIESCIDQFLLEGLKGDTVHEYRGEGWEDMNQETYRQYCIRLLELAGWKLLSGGEEKAEHPPVIAERGGRTLLLTCINASSPVGRGHIRRTSASRQKYGADMAAVVTNAGFSRWALKASLPRQVMPLHHEDLANL